MDNQKQPKTKKSLLKKGVIVFIVSLLFNSAFIAFGIGGILHELARLAVIVGFVMIIIGAIRKFICKCK